MMENEYARIGIEQGLPGLTLWVVFLGWVFLRRPGGAKDGWALGRLLGWVAARNVLLLWPDRHRASQFGSADGTHADHDRLVRDRATASAVAVRNPADRTEAEASPHRRSRVTRRGADEL